PPREPQPRARSGGRMKFSSSYTVSRAKRDILERLCAHGGARISMLVDQLLSARTLRELAERALSVSMDMEAVVGHDAAHEFWLRAKTILLLSRDNASRGK